MKKGICFILFIAVSTALLGFGAGAAKAVGEANNGVFAIIKVGSDSVEFKTMAKTKVYSVEFVAGKEAFPGARISNSVGDMVFPSGATAIPGSSLLMPSTKKANSLTVTSGAKLKVSEFKAPENFKAEKIRFLTEKGAAPMVYDIATSTWEENAAKP